MRALSVCLCCWDAGAFPSPAPIHSLKLSHCCCSTKPAQPSCPLHPHIPSELNPGCSPALDQPCKDKMSRPVGTLGLLLCVSAVWSQPCFSQRCGEKGCPAGTGSFGGSKLLRAFQSSHLTFGPMSSGGAAEPNLSLLNCFLISCWKVIVSRFCGRGNQANKLTCSTTAVSLCLSLLAPMAPCSISCVLCGHQLGFVPKLWRGVAAAQTALVLALQGRHFGKTRLSQGTRCHTWRVLPCS